MAEPFKNLLNKSVIEGMAGYFAQHCSSFEKKAFVADATHNLEQLELKQRTDRIVESMVTHLPDDFEQAAGIVLASLNSSSDADHPNGISGWAVISLTYYVGLQGKNKKHFNVSMTLLKAMTKLLSSEFGIRFFIMEQPIETLALLKQWATDPDHNIRRLVSEGTRPRLPWGMRLQMFVDDPAPVIELLELLKDDESEYVRRSVANNLNDIAKDHPERVAGIAERWMQGENHKGVSKHRERLVRHACRTLIKAGHQKTLAVFGYKPPSIREARIEITTPLKNTTPEVVFGGDLEFSLSLESGSTQKQALIIDYVIHHQKANGKTSPKVFKWKVTHLLPNKRLDITKKHAIKKITTRKYYPGEHRVEVMINGKSFAAASFELVMP
jgi:3-methyladenine DNA glycosylase AlkC